MNTAKQMLAKLQAWDAEFREWQKQNNIDIDKDLDGDWYGIGLAANSVMGWMKTQKHFAFLIEIKGDDGVWKPCEVAIRFNCSLYHDGEDTPTENQIFKVAPPWLNIFLKEYPEVRVEGIIGDGFDSIGERMGIYCSVKDVEEDGGLTTGYDNCGCRFRIVKKEISGEWSEKTQQWLARHPFVTLEIG